MRVSVVISTDNRAASLSRTLEGLTRQIYANFEVIVVTGPSADSTPAVIERYAGGIKRASCPTRNLSQSRNIGIRLSDGDVIAFIDDDAVPSERWLADLIAGFDEDEVAGVGGLVFDHTGYQLQYRYAVADRLGNPRWNLTRAPLHMCFPGAPETPYLQGTNCAFRRSVLLEVGGFDEEYEYHLDETDLCQRIVDAGYVIKPLDNAWVYHSYLENAVRAPTRRLFNWYPLIKNKIYYSLKNRPDVSLSHALQDAVAFCRAAEDQMKWQLSAGLASEDLLAQFHLDVDRALRDGLTAGMKPGRKLARPPFGSPNAFLPFRRVTPDCARMVIVLLSQEYPPGVVGGIGRYTAEVATGLAASGHTVHVITNGVETSTVSFESGIWVHRIVDDGGDPLPLPPALDPPWFQWRRACSMLREVERINSMDPIGVVEAPLWDAEGMAIVADGRFPCVTSLHTPLKSVIHTTPDWPADCPVEGESWEQFINAERFVLQRSAALRANSQAIIATIRELYGVDRRPPDVRVIPHGIADRSGRAVDHSTETVDVLFIGRLEARKGVDVLLETVPGLCALFPQVRFVLIGEDSRIQAGKQTYREQFQADPANAGLGGRVVFTGPLPDEELEKRLASCAIFVAPSRFESFGLVFLQAMMWAKPCVGCRTGGIPEVIEEGVTGLLAEPGDAASLRYCLEMLLTDSNLRTTMGLAGRERYLARFTQQGMVRNTIEFYQQVLRQARSRLEPCPV